MVSFAEDIQRFAAAFVGLQDERHAADYDPTWTRFESQVTDWINETREVIGRFERTSPADRRAFAAHVLFRRRS